MKKPKYYLAYGSNLDVRQMAWRCPNASVVGTAVLKDWKLLFRGSKTGAYLTIEPEVGSEVPVAVWEITEADERSLDRYEGFPDFYYKQSLQVDAHLFKPWGKDATIEAMVYIMHEDRPLGVPSRFYVEICAGGYDTFGFDPEPLKAAVAASVKEVKSA